MEGFKFMGTPKSRTALYQTVDSLDCHDLTRREPGRRFEEMDILKISVPDKNTGSPRFCH